MGITEDCERELSNVHGGHYNEVSLWIGLVVLVQIFERVNDVGLRGLCYIDSRDSFLDNVQEQVNGLLATTGFEISFGSITKDSHD